MSLALLAVLAVSPAAAVRYGRPEMIRLDSLPAAYRYNATGEKECNVCVQFADQFLDQLLNIILNGGVIGSCEDLCAKIQGSNVEKAACDLICDGVGLKEFIKAIEAADLDPIWLCEDLGECPHNNCTSSCASIVSATVDPPSGPVGTNFVYEITFSINSANVGSGEIQFGAKRDGDKENYEYEEGGLATPFPAPGTYQIKLPINTSDGPPNYFAGHYRSNATVCAGLCGSKHEWSSVLANAAGAEWDITN